MFDEVDERGHQSSKPQKHPHKRQTRVIDSHLMLMAFMINWYLRLMGNATNAFENRVRFHPPTRPVLPSLSRERAR
eukprot:scaffold13273_cov35-Attheya_sp.AAC.2